MQTYAWRERTPQPDREYRRLHARPHGGSYPIVNSRRNLSSWREEGGVK